MPGPTPTFNQFAVDNLLKPTPDIFEAPITKGTINFQIPASGHGNIDFPYSYSKNKAVDNPMADGLRKFFNSGPSEKFMTSTIKYNADEINAARYVTSPDYLKLGISLSGNNEENYGQNQSWSEVLSNGATGMGKLAANGFVDTWKGWGRMTDALTHWDWSKLHGDAESMLESDARLKEIMNSSPIYATEEGTKTFWNRQNFGNFLQQSGFTVGALAATLSEQIITKAIEAGLAATVVGAPISGELEVISDVKAAANIGRIASFFNKSKEFFNASKAMKNLTKLGNLWTDEKILKNFAKGLGERIPGVDIAMDISKTYRTGIEAGLSGTKLAGDIAKVGFGGLKRTMSEANFAFSESKMEAAGTFSDLYNQMQDDHFKRTGSFAEGIDLQMMQNTAMKAADKNFNFNSAVLAVSNRIMFDNVFKNSKITSKILSQFGEDVGEKGFRVLGKINGKATSQYYTGGILKNYKTIAADFGTRKARKVLAKSIMTPFLQFEAVEGIQELLQEGSNEYYKDYYLNSYKATYNPDIKPNSQESLDKAISSQMTMQGLKTFASGALTGMMIHGPTVLVSKAGKKLGETVKDAYKTSGFSKEDKEQYFTNKKESKEELQNYYNEFNAIAKDPSKFFSESIKNFNVQKEGASALDEAAKLGDKFAYENIRTDMLHSMVSQAVRNDTHEALADTLREYGKHMSKEEFEQAFVGLDYTSENKKSAADYTEKVANSVEFYAKTYNKLQEKYGSRVNPNRYALGTQEYNKERAKKQVLNNMIDLLASNEFKSTDAINRSLDLYTKATSHKSLGSSLSSAYNVLGSDENNKKEISVLNLEIETKKQQLESEGITIETKNQLKSEIKLKEKQKESLEEWAENKDDLSDKPKLTKSYEAFKNYLELKNLEFGKTRSINVSDVEDLFVEFNDYIKLNKKSQDHVDAINMLSNPKYFNQVYERMLEGSERAYLQLLHDAAAEEIAAGKTRPDEHFIIEVNGMYGVFTPSGKIVFVANTLEEAREVKKKLDTVIYSKEDLEEMFSDSVAEVDEELAEEKEKEVKKESKKEEGKKEIKFVINGKVAVVISEKIDAEDNLKIFEYVFEDDANKEVYQFKIIDKKPIDVDTGEEITLSRIEPTEKLGDKSIDEQITELEAKIKALPDGGMVTTDGGMTPSEELKNLNDQIKALKAQKETKEEVTTTSDIEAKKVLIQKEVQEAKNRIVDIENNLLPKINNRLNNNLQPELNVLYEKLKNTKDEVLKKDINNQIEKLNKQRLTKSDINDLELQKDSFEGQIKSAKQFIEKKNAELAALEEQPTTSTSTPKLTKEELKKSNPEFFNKDGNISIADMSNDTFIKFMSGVIFDLKDEIESNNSPYTVIQSLVDSLGPNMTSGASSTLLLAASEETKNYLKEIYNFYQNSVYGKNYWRSGMEENLKKYGIQKLIDKTNEIITRDNITTFKKIDSLSLDEYLKIKLGFSFLFQYPNQNRFYTDFLFNPETNQTLFRIPSKQVLDDFKEINKIFRENNVPGYSEIKEKFLKLENFKNLSEEELIDLYNTKNLTLDNFNSVKNESTVEEQPASTPKLTKEEALENLKEIFKENAFLYEEKELSNVDINKFNTVAVDLYNVAKNILTEQELNKVLEKLSISDVNNLPLNKAIELSLGLKGVLLSRENISDKVGVLRNSSDKSNYDYLINDIPFNNKFKIVTEDSLKRNQGNSEFISKFVNKLKENNVGSISNVAYEGHIIQVDYGIEKSSTEKLLSSLLNQVNEALVQFGNPRLLTEQYNVSIEGTYRNNKGFYEVIYENTYAEGSSNAIVDSFNLTLPKDLQSILLYYTIQIKATKKGENKELRISPKRSINVDINIAKKYGLPTKSDDDTLKLDLNQPVTSTESEEDNDTIDDIDQTFDDKKDVLDTDSTEADKIFQEGIKQTEPALSLGNTTHFVKTIEIKPGVERFERNGVNETYEFEIATPTFMPGKSVTFKVDEFDSTNYDDANIGIYSIINNKEVRIGAVHTPQWIAEQKGSNKAYTHIVIPESEKNSKLPKTLEKELEINESLRKLILDNYKNNPNFVLNGTINDKSVGIIVTMNEQGTLAERLNPEIGKGGLENRHGMFGIIRDGSIQIDKGYTVDTNKLVPVKSFNSENISQYKGYSILLIPSPTGQFFPTFIKLPNVAREQSEFILKAWKAFTKKETNPELVKQVYEAVGDKYKEGDLISLDTLKTYINHYITNLNSKPLSILGNGVDAPENTSRLDIFTDGNIKIQGKIKLQGEKDSKWINITIRKEEDIPDNILEYMDKLITTIRFTDSRNDALLGINSTDKVSIFGVKNEKLYNTKMTYNQYIMEGAKTYLEKGIESKNKYNDWVYFANPVLKFQYAEPIKEDTLFNKDETKEQEPVSKEVFENEPEEDLFAQLERAVIANNITDAEVKEESKKCTGNPFADA